MTGLPEIDFEDGDDSVGDDDIESLAARADAARIRRAAAFAAQPDDPVPLTGELPDPSKPLPKRPRWCALCGCMLERAATYCDGCARVAQLDRRRASLHDAIETLPAAHRWTLETPALVSLVGADAIAKARSAIDATTVTLVGESGAGKTSLAVAMARAIIDRALDLDRATHAEVERARGLRFVTSFDLAHARADTKLGKEPEIICAAKSAVVLVLDDLGAEGKAPGSPIGEVIHYRRGEGTTTIVTTWLSGGEISDWYGKGVLRRLTDASVVIPLKGRAKGAGK